MHRIKSLLKLSGMHMNHFNLLNYSIYTTIHLMDFLQFTLFPPNTSPFHSGTSRIPTERTEAFPDIAARYPSAYSEKTNLLYSKQSLISALLKKHS